MTSAIVLNATIDPRNFREADTSLAPPVRVSNRQNRMMIAARFDQQFTTDENLHQWGLADAMSVDASANYLVRRTLRMRCRYEYHNNAYFMGAANRLAQFIVGTGPRLHMNVDPKIGDVIEKRFQRWARLVHLGEKLRTDEAARFYNGEGFLLLRTNPKIPDPVKLDVFQIESDQVQSPLFGTYPAQYPDQYFDGVVLDPWGNPETYHILRQHPGAFGAFVIMGYEYDPWPAKYVLHSYERMRPGQQRGIPEAVPALGTFAELRRYMQAVRAAAETAADHAGFIKTAGPADTQGGDATTEPDTGFGTAMDYVNIKRRMMGVLPRGWDAFQMKAEQPATTMDMFTMVCLTEISQTLDMPLFLLTGDARLANMSSAYVATQSFMNKVRTRRSTRESQLDRIFAEFIDEARMIDGYLPGDLSPTEELDHAWRWDKVTRHADPEKGASASSIKIKTGASCPSIEVAEEGGDYEELENRAAKDYGVTVEEYRAALFQSTFTARGTVPPATLAPHTGYVDPGDTSKVDPDSEQ